MEINGTYYVDNRKYSFPEKEKVLKQKLTILRRKMNHMEVSLTTYEKNDPEFFKARKKLNIIRTEYLQVLNQLNDIKSTNKRKMMKDSSQGLKKVDFSQLRDQYINKDKAANQFTNLDSVGNQKINSPYLNYRHNVMDAVIY